MKCATYILLFLFVGFTIIPTVVTLFSNESNNIELYDIIEEESQEKQEENKESNYLISCNKYKFSENNYIIKTFSQFTYNEKLIYSFSQNIFIPPPNFFKFL